MSPYLLIGFGLLFFMLVGGIGVAANRNLIPQKLIDHPLVFALSLAGYTGTWAISGALSIANQGGYLYLAYFFGTSALFIFSPLIIRPLYSITSAFQLSSLADLFSFRYKSQTAGAIIACFVIISVLPLMAIQVDKMAETAVYLNNPLNSIRYEQYKPWAWGFISFILLLSILLVPKKAQHKKNNGLVFGSACLSLFKLLAFLILGVVALFFVFDGPQSLETWLYSNPSRILQLNSSIISNNARTLIVIFFAGTLAFPHLFHLTFAEKPTRRVIDTASWAFPAYLLLISLPILPILWAAQANGVPNVDYLYALSLGFLTHSPWVLYLAYFCMLSAATTSLVVIAMSTSQMCINHLVLPNLSLPRQITLFQNLQLARRILIGSILLMTMLVLEWSKQLTILMNFSFAAFSAACQFLPGILALLYWPKGNRAGLILGLLAGFFCWLIAILLPMIHEDAFGLMPLLMKYFDLAPNSYFTIATTACLGVNMLVFWLVSHLTKMTEDEKYAAAICAQDSLSLPARQKLTAQSARQFIELLGLALGHEEARRIVEQAAGKLSIQPEETSPFILRLLRRQIEADLSGLYGPTIAHQIISKHLPVSGEATTNKDIRLIEQNLENHKHHLSGLAIEIDKLRRYHRQTIEALPIGVCTLGHDLEILQWNQLMADLTGQSPKALVGAHLSMVHEPWQQALRDFLHRTLAKEDKVPLSFDGHTRWFTFFKTRADAEQALFKENTFTIIIEEVTETVLLENEVLHSERLASIGRLAAGVAHEIGNPVTGIACLAQNLPLDSDAPAVKDTANMITEQTTRIRKILQALINFSHAGSSQQGNFTQAVNLHDCAEDAVHLLSLEDKTLTKTVTNAINPTLQVLGDPQRILQVFINLITNAVAASQEDPSIVLESQLQGKLVVLHITDNGEGIPENIQSKIFEPFFTTKLTGSGTGLGLSLVYSIIEEHKGNIRVVSPMNKDTQSGTCFSIKLPLYQHERL